jgi:hypothetical protein
MKTSILSAALVGTASAVSNVCEPTESGSLQNVDTAWCSTNCHDGEGVLAPACDPVQGFQLCQCTDYREITEADLLDRLDGWWTGQLVGNFMGLPFEFVYYEEPMPIEPQKIYNESMADAEGLMINRFPDDRCCWPERLAELEGAATDDDTDVEYVTAFALDEHGLSLDEAQLQEYWVKAMNIYSSRTGGQTLWFANAIGRLNMDSGLVPPATGSKEHNQYWWTIDPQLVNEIWSVVYPGMVPLAVERADWGASITSRDWGKDPTLFYGAMYGLLPAFHSFPSFIHQPSFLPFVPSFVPFLVFFLPSFLP